MSNLDRLRVFLVDDESLALARLSRLLDRSGRVEILGSSTDPEDAIVFLAQEKVDVVFLDIQMPGINGFELLAQLRTPPMVIFTTAFNEYALRAFEVNSIDYLLKPVEEQHLDRALNKVERLRGQRPDPDFHTAISEIASAVRRSQRHFPARIASRLGERTQFIDLSSVTHFSAENKLIYAVTPTKRYVVDQSIAELEQRLDPRQFVRIHRAILLNSNYVGEVHQWFAGRAIVRLKDGTELTVARDRVRGLKEHLQI